MARYPSAVWAEIPENSSQPHITPTQIVLHSSTSTDAKATVAYFARPDVVVESHFVMSYDGTVYQTMDTVVRGDAQFQGNARAISIETASNAGATDVWTDSQVNALVALIRWICLEHAIPAKACGTYLDPGIGYHRQFQEWNGSGHTCPGDARVKQIPQIIAMAATSGSPKVNPAPTHDYVVQKNDTLWKIARAAGLAGVAGVAAIMAYSGLHSTTIVPGQVLHVPGPTVTITAPAITPPIAPQPPPKVVVPSPAPPIVVRVPAPVTRPVVYLSHVRPGLKNAEIRLVQRRLGMPARYQTGYYGPITKSYVYHFQLRNFGPRGADGIIGRQSLARLGFTVY